MNPLKVLVTNASRRKAVPIVRALGGAGMYVVCADSGRSAMAFYSRHCREKLLHPPLQSENFRDFIISWLSKNRCDVIFPLDDDALEVFSKYQNLLPNPRALLLPDYATVAKTLDKSYIVPYASKLGIPIPRTNIIRTNEDLRQLSSIELPVIVKLSHSSGSRGMARISKTNELKKVCETMMSQGKSVLVQEQLPLEGEGLGYFALYDRNHRPVAQFMHRRLREYPLSGGPSTLREGIWDENLARQSRFLLESLGWVGLAMVEYKKDLRDGIPKFMEINPRFWGSIALPIFSGVNFPVLAAKVTMDEPVDRIVKYPLGKKARWLWPGDILHLISSLRQGRWPKKFFNFFDHDMCYDIFSLNDPGPVFALLVSTVLALTSRNGWRLITGRNRFNCTSQE